MEIIKPVVEGMPVWLVTLLVTLLALKMRVGRPSHYFRIRQASQKLSALAKERSVQRQYYLLRSVDPFVFEEMILTALKQAGHSIRRNTRYTGDGGIDGMANINGTKVLIQAKRYRSHINPRHVEEFIALCAKRRCPGLFVHTGKTGKASRQAASGGRVQIMSGEKMLDLLCGRKVNFQNL